LSLGLVHLLKNWTACAQRVDNRPGSTECSINAAWNKLGITLGTKPCRTPWKTESRICHPSRENLKSGRLNDHS
jgi:hypothetical protein